MCNQTIGAGLPDGRFVILKIPIWVHFGGPWNINGWYIIRTFGI
jgi:hypothetical protein